MAFKDENGDGGKTENIEPELTAKQVNMLIAKAVQMMAENQPAKIITEGSPEYRARLEAEGFYDNFPKPVYQNGREAEPRGLSEETRTRVANLRPGLYLGGKLTVEHTPNGGVHLKYKSKTVEDRMSGPATLPFAEMVDRIWAEMHATTAA